MLAAAGTPGKRGATPNSRILIHQPSGGGEGSVSDLEIQANEIGRMRVLLEEILARHTGQDVETIRNDIEHDKIFSAEEAKAYGLIDTVVPYRKLSGPVGNAK